MRVAGLLLLAGVAGAAWWYYRGTRRPVDAPAPGVPPVSGVAREEIERAASARLLELRGLAKRVVL